MIGLAPDVVIVAGDIFHSVRPTNQAILHAFLQFSRLVRELPNAIVVLVAGNHDTPRSTETGGILPLLAQLGLHVVDRKPERLLFPERELSILAIPDVPGLEQPALTPDSGSRFNVLVIHGEVPGIVPTWASVADRAADHLPHEGLIGLVRAGPWQLDDVERQAEPVGLRVQQLPPNPVHGDASCVGVDGAQEPDDVDRGVLPSAVQRERAVLAGAPAHPGACRGQRSRTAP